jgi:hypothetical protein
MATNEELNEQYPILRWFDASHLPDDVRDHSEAFGRLAWTMAQSLPRCAETSAMLRKLLEAKDCAVRAAILGEEQPGGSRFTRGE